MAPAPCEATAPVPPPAYHRAQAKRRAALHLDALTLVRQLHLLALSRMADSCLIAANSEQRSDMLLARA